MTDWYRNTDWNAGIEAAFEAKLSRARAQKAQYLRIQGSTLKDSHPEVAVCLLARCIDAGEPMFVVHALLDSAHAHYRLGDVDTALDTLEAAIERQRVEPRYGSSAPFDYPFLVALHGRSDRFDRALEILADQAEPLLPEMMFEREAALAIILSERGNPVPAAEAATRALATRGKAGSIPGFPLVGAVSTREHPLVDRLQAIASQAG